MLTYREADEYTAPDVEAVLRANPAIYWETVDLLPASALDGFPCQGCVYLPAPTVVAQLALT